MPQVIKNFFRKTGETMNSMFSENPRSISSGRVAFFFTVVLSNIVVFSMWIIMCFKTGSLVNIPEGVIWVYATANGISFTGKVAQSFSEGKYRSKQEIIEEEQIDQEEEFELARKEILKRESTSVRRGRPKGV